MSGTQENIKFVVPEHFELFMRSGVFRCRIDLHMFAATDAARPKIVICVQVRDLVNWV